MARGGARPGAGRKPGSKAQKTKQRLQAATVGLSNGISPLDVLLDAMRDAHLVGNVREATSYAALAAPYVHPRLSTVNANANLQGGVTVKVVSEFPDG